MDVGGIYTKQIIEQIKIKIYIIALLKPKMVFSTIIFTYKIILNWQRADDQIRKSETAGGLRPQKGGVNTINKFNIISWHKLREKVRVYLNIIMSDSKDW